MIRIFVIFTVFFLGCSELPSWVSDRVEGTRYIVYGKHIKVSQHIRNLKHSDAFVAYLTGNDLDKLDSLGVRYELDQRRYASGSCEKDPSPPPPDSEPGSTQVIPWGVEAIGAPKAWTVAKGKGVIVCVVDTGVDKNHEDLQGRIVGGSSYYDGDYQDDNSHGTHVAGTILANDNGVGVVGVAPEARLFAVKALDSNGSGWDSDISDGIHDCVDNDADVINLSLGAAAPSTAIRNSIVAAVNAGVIVVAAAGNESTSTGYPAAYPEVISVSAVDSIYRLAYFSNTGKIEYAAPGVDVKSTVPGGYSSYNGTSMASPHVAGAVALMLSAGKKDLYARDIGLSSSEQGHGFIDADRTVH